MENQFLDKKPSLLFFSVLILVLNNWHIFLKRFLLCCNVLWQPFGSSKALSGNKNLGREVGLEVSYQMWEDLNGIDPIKLEEFNHCKNKNGRTFRGGFNESNQAETGGI